MNRLGTRLARLERAAGPLPERCRVCAHLDGQVSLDEWRTGRWCHCESCACGEFPARALQRWVAAQATLAEFEEVKA